MILFGQHQGSFNFPVQASSFAEGVDSLYMIEYAISTVFFVLIVGVMGYFVWKYRKRPGHERPIPSSSHNTWLEIAWTVLPCFLLVWMFIQGAYGYLELRNPPDNCKEIWVTAQQWSWSFHYPEEGPSADLHLSKDQPVKLRLASSDVLHSFYIPEFRQKMDIIPGRYVWVWFNPTKASGFLKPFHLRCTEYCGTGHSAAEMSQKPVYVHDMPWDEMLAAYVRWDESKKSSVDNGERLYKMLCAGCHSKVKDEKKIGPSFNGNWGAEVQFTDGSSAVVDENYIKNSILEPNSQVRSGYASANGSSQMPALFNGRQLNESEISYLIAYIKSLNGVSEEAVDPTAEADNPAEKTDPSKADNK